MPDIIQFRLLLLFLKQTKNYFFKFWFCFEHQQFDLYESNEKELLSVKYNQKRLHII